MSGFRWRGLRAKSMRGAAVALGTLAAASLGMLVAAHAQEADVVKTLTGSYNASGLAMYRALARSPGNVVLSPYSIGTALAMAWTGARGETAAELGTALKLAAPRDAVDAANAALLKVLNSYDRTADAKACAQGTAGKAKDGAACVGSPARPSAVLIAANALALPKGTGVADAYVDLVRSSYAAEVLQVGGAGDINAWVAGKTAGKIPTIIESPPTGPVLINAVYLRAAWGTPFEPSFTKDGAFQLSATARVTVPLMHQREQLALVQRTGYRAVTLNYAERSLGLVVVLPDEVEGLAGVTDRLDAAELGGLLADLGKAVPQPVKLTLPRFKASLTADLVPLLKAAGARLAFSDGADFGGITGAKGGLKIDGITHRAIIEVDEHGTEAAAATAVAMARSAAPNPIPPVEFAVDRPFLFLIVDKASGAVLFQGRIADPSKRE